MFPNFETPLTRHIAHIKSIEFLSKEEKLSAVNGYEAQSKLNIKKQAEISVTASKMLTRIINAIDYISNSRQPYHL